MKAAMIVAAAAALLVAAPAAAQGIVAPVGASPAKVEADIRAAQEAAIAAAVAAVAPQLCPPGNVMPKVESTSPSAGVALTCRRSDDVQPRITRAAVTTTDSTGGWSVTWATSLMAAPAVIPVPVNATTQPVVCNVTTRTMTTAAGRCWLARPLPATLVSLTALLTYDVFGQPTAGIQVQVLAIPLTQ